MSTTNNQQTEIELKSSKWKCNECGYEYSGVNIVCPSCDFADVEEIAE